MKEKYIKLLIDNYYLSISVLVCVLLIVCVIYMYKKNQDSKKYSENITAQYNELIQKYQEDKITLAKLTQSFHDYELLQLDHKEMQDTFSQIKEQLGIFKTKTDEKNEQNIELKQTINALNKNKEILQSQIQRDKEEISTLQTKLIEQNKAMNEKMTILQDSEEKLKLEFENLANKIFENSSKKFKQESQESLGNILNPVKIQLNEFKKKVEDVYDKEAKDRSALQNELKNLKELNEKMTQETYNLTKALKSESKKQGNWGEMVLENVLESSGLRQGHEYKREVSLKDDEGKTYRPDVIVNLPDKRHVIIDAKTSLLSYSEYMASENEEEKKHLLQSHLHSIKEHIKSLANKRYENLQEINTLDFIFMFIPIEGALHLALDYDVNLYDKAFSQKIILVSPTTLLVALRAVENTWRYERQAQNIALVYKRAEELYKKFYGFIEDLKKVGESLDKANETYDEAFKKLSQGKGNLINQVNSLKVLSNIKPKKEISESLVQNSMIDNE